MGNGDRRLCDHALRGRERPLEPARGASLLPPAPHCPRSPEAAGDGGPHGGDRRDPARGPHRQRSGPRVLPPARLPHGPAGCPDTTGGASPRSGWPGPWPSGRNERGAPRHPSCIPMPSLLQAGARQAVPEPFNPSAGQTARTPNLGGRRPCHEPRDNPDPRADAVGAEGPCDASVHPGKSSEARNP